MQWPRKAAHHLAGANIVNLRDRHMSRFGADAFVHHLFLIQYFRRWRGTLYVALIAMLAVATAFLMDHQSYFTAGVTAFTALGLLTTHIGNTIRTRRQARIEAHEITKREEERAERKAARGEKIEHAKTLTVETTKRIAGTATAAFEAAKSGITVTTSEATQKAKAAVADTATAVKTKTKNIGIRSRLIPWLNKDQTP
jgi:hypothetical protein